MFLALRKALPICGLLVALVSAPAPGALPELVSPGEPPITGQAVRDHVRLIEYTLGTRLTTGQKELFLETLKKECADMDPEGRKAFLEASKLVTSMTSMNPDQRQVIREILREDFEGTAADDEADPAAQLYMQVRDGTTKIIAAQGSDSVSLQDLEAFTEYLGFARSPDKPETLQPAERDGFMRAMADGFPGYTEQVRQHLSGFDKTWHLLRAGWLAADEPTRNRWKTGLKAAAEKASSGNGPAGAVDPALWDEMKQVASAAGEIPDGWQATPTLAVW
ncbi:MAG TPA: hypothetical protein PLU72_16215 [Candidatus Ozemobacteraceae bacterium]|nr:hypothetical protein [Candidatus Ozemobacteraceae bacterium]